MNQESIRLEARDLCVGYSGKCVVAGVEFSLRAGEILALVGPNGAGKSTLLKSLARQLALQGGTVFLSGHDMTDLNANETAKELSVLLTGQRSPELMTCREMVAAGRYPYTGRMGILSQMDWDKVDAAMARLHAEDLADRMFDAISDGQRQRVLLARALCQEPKVLLLDEPTAYLDIRYQLELVETLRSLARDEGLAVVVSLHELDLVRRCADRVLCLKNERVDRLDAVGSVFSGNYLETLFDLPEGSLCAAGETAANCGVSAPSENALDMTGTQESDVAASASSGETSNATEAPAFQHYVQSGSKQLRCGYTTGTCAALAAQGAAVRLLTGVWPETVRLVTPKGLPVEVVLEACRTEVDADTAIECAAICGVRKDAGDDIDATAGMLIEAQVRYRTEPGITIEGGLGIGRVTRPGLDQPVGAAAINSVPRRMILEAVQSVCAAADYTGGLTVNISAPQGEEIAGKTMNGYLGIQGGISILGTSGIVEPMSQQALIDTIRLELRQRYAEGNRCVILTLGNYGLDYLREQGFDQLGVPVVKCSNYIGDALDMVRSLGYQQVLLVGHIGKLIKVAGGIMNSHSKVADGRLEMMVTHCALAGGSTALCKSLMACATTDACIALLQEAGLVEAVMRSLMEAIERQLQRRIGEEIPIGAIMFSKEYGELGRTALADRLLEEWRTALEL